MKRAPATRIVSSVQRALSSIVVLAAIIGGASVPAFAGMIHPVCVSKHHECGATPKISKCCCGDEQSAQTESTPGQSRVDLRATFSCIAAVSTAIQVALTPHTVHTGGSTPPHNSSVGLPILFSSLLI